MSPLMHQWQGNAVLGHVFPEMIDAIQCIRSEGIKTALLTNNWRFADGKTLIPVDIDLFDVVSFLPYFFVFYL
jgi:acyl-CoA dehydrogenase family protein 10